MQVGEGDNVITSTPPCTNVTQMGTCSFYSPYECTHVMGFYLYESRFSRSFIASMAMDSTPVNVLAMYKFLTEQMFGKRDVPGLPKYLKNSNISPLVCTKPTCK